MPLSELRRLASRAASASHRKVKPDLPSKLMVRKQKQRWHRKHSKCSPDPTRAGCSPDPTRAGCSMAVLHLVAGVSEGWHSIWVFVTPRHGPPREHFATHQHRHAPLLHPSPLLRNTRIYSVSESWLENTHQRRNFEPGLPSDIFRTKLISHCVYTYVNQHQTG